MTLWNGANEITVGIAGKKYLKFEYVNTTTGQSSVSVKHHKHWYKIITEECPVCGRGRTYRERQYTPRPSNDNDRYEYTPYYDYCEG